MSSLYNHTIRIKGLRPILWLAACVLLTYTSAEAVPVTIRLTDAGGRDFPVDGTFEDPVVVDCFVLKATVPAGAASVTIDVPANQTLYCIGAPRPGFKRGRGTKHWLDSSVSIPYGYVSGSIKFTFRDRLGAPYLPQDGRISCKSLGAGEDSYELKTHPRFSSLRVPFEPGSFRCELSVPGAIVTPQHQLVTVTNSQTSEISYTVLERDSVIDFALFDPSQSLYLGDVNSPTQVSCASTSGTSPLIFSTDVPSSGSGYLPVVGGYSYSCSIISPRGDLLWSRHSVAVEAGSSSSVSFNSSAKAATINVKLVDTLEQPLTLSPKFPAPKVTCRDRDEQAEDAYASFSPGSSEVSVPADIGRYACSIENLSGYHVSTPPSQIVSTRAGEPQDYPVVLIQNTAELAVVFTSTSGARLPVPALSSSARVECTNGEERLTASPRAGATSVMFKVAGGSTYDCLVAGFDGYADGVGSVTIGDGQFGQASIALRAKSGRLDIYNPFAQGYFFSDPTKPFFEARSTTSPLFSASLPQTEYATGATLSVVDSETYTCSAAVPGKISTAATVFVGPNGSSSANLSVLQGDSTLNLRLVDPAANVATDVRNAFVELEAISDTVRHSRPVVFKGGVASLAIKSGVPYKIRLRSSDNESEPIFYRHNGGSYYLKDPEASFQASPGESVSKDFLLAPPSASLEVFSSRNRGEVTIRPASLSAAGKSAGTIHKRLDGRGALFELPPDEYEVLFHGVGIAQKRIVLVSAGDTNRITFDEPLEDRIIKVSTTDLSPVAGPVVCNAYSASVGATQEQRGTIGGAPIYLAVSSQSSQWEVLCRGWDSVLGSLYVGRGSYSFADITNPNEVGSVEISLDFDEQTFTTSTSAQASDVIRLLVSGIVEVTAPIGAFDRKETVRLSATGAASAPATASIAPLRVFRFSATTARLEPLLSQEPISATVTLLSNYSVYGYSKRRGYVQLHQATTTQPSPAVVDVIIPADIFNEGVLVIGAMPTDPSNRAPQATPTATHTPTPTITPTPTPTPTRTPTRTPTLTPTPTPSATPSDPIQPIPSEQDTPPPPPTKLVAQSLKTFIKTKRTLVVTWLPSEGSVDSFTVKLEQNGNVVRTSSVSGRSNPTARLGNIAPGRYVVRVASVRGSSTSSWISRSVRVK